MNQSKTLGQIAFEAFWERWNKELPNMNAQWNKENVVTCNDWEACARAIIEEAGRRIENQLKKGRY